MAKNWKVGEAVKVLRKGSDIEGMMDIGKRFPLFAMLAVQTNDAAQKMFDAIPEMISARQLESRLRGDAGEDDGEEREETPKPKYADEYDEMTTKELAALVKKRKLEIKETYLTSKPYMIKTLRAADADSDEDEAPKAKTKAKKPADDEDEEEEAQKPKAKSKKPAPDPEEEDDEDEEPAPKAKSKKKPAPADEDDEDEEEAPKPKSKAKSKAKADDDEWDI